MVEFYSMEVPLCLKYTIFPLQVGFETSNFRQVPCSPTVQIRGSNRTHFLMSFQKSQLLANGRPSKPTCVKEERNGLPSANQALFKYYIKTLFPLWSIGPYSLMLGQCTCTSSSNTICGPVSYSTRVLGKSVMIWNLSCATFPVVAIQFEHITTNDSNYYLNAAPFCISCSLRTV